MTWEPMIHQGLMTLSLALNSNHLELEVVDLKSSDSLPLVGAEELHHLVLIKICSKCSLPRVDRGA